MIQTKGYAAFDPQSPLRPYEFSRREPGDHDVVIDVLHCGICHSDLHQVKNEWQGSTYPMVPGHEIVGRVSRVGSKVTRFAAGDAAGVGCFVDSCRRCPACERGVEQYCEEKVIWTYNSTDKNGQATQGGYSTCIVVDEKYTLKVDKRLPLERVAPLLCAGITTWSPLRHWKAGKGSRVAVLGLGGLGHMAVKLAASLGAEVTLLSSSPKKREDAKRLGAHEFVVTTEGGALEKLRGRFDLILDSVSAPHALEPYLETLRTDGTMVLLGIPDAPPQLHPAALILRRRALTGSLIGGIAETQEMLDYCARHDVLADVEPIPAQRIDEAYARMLKSDVRYRFVIDASTIER